MSKIKPMFRLSRLAVIMLFQALLVLASVSAETSLTLVSLGSKESNFTYFHQAVNFLWKKDHSGQHHVWPEMRFGWPIVVGTIIGIFGAAFGSVGGVGGGGIFVPMLSLIIGFDPKSSTAISKCMIMGAAIATVIYNIKLRHPTLDMPIIDYDLVLIIQPMLMLGISIGVAFNVIFADWMITVLIIILSVGTSTRAFFKGIETWKRESIVKEELAKQLTSISKDDNQLECQLLPDSPSSITTTNTKKLKPEVGILENIRWKEVGLLTFVWVAYLILQIAMSNTAKCSNAYWVLNCFQLPVSIGVYLFEAIGLYKGYRVIASKGVRGMNMRVPQLAMYCASAVLAGIIGGLLGIGGGFVMGPLFLELGIPPEVTSATATFGMTYSASMSVVEYYLLGRFPIPYALYFILVATVAGFVGQHIVRKLIIITGRASIIVFILSFTIFVSAICLGGFGVSNMIGKIKRQDYMGFESLCDYH